MVHDLLLILFDLFIALPPYFFDDVFQLGEVHQSAFGFVLLKDAGIFRFCS